MSENQTLNPSATGVAFAPGGASIPDRDAATRRETAPAGTPATAMQSLAKNAAVNPADVQFPADPWGFTSELRKVGLLAASKVNGQADKHLVLMGTLMVIQGHVRNRQETDRDAFAAQLLDVAAANEEAEKYTRQYARPYDPEVAVKAALATVAEAKRSGLFPELVGE